MEKKVYIIIGLAIIVVAAGWLAYSNGFWQNSAKQGDTIQQAPAIENEAMLVIDYGQGNPTAFTTEFRSGMTAFDLLKNEAEKSNINLETKSYDIGIMIEAIGDKKNGQDGKYWLYYINGEMPMVSADKMVLKAGDKVEFKFEKSPY